MLPYTLIVLGVWLILFCVVVYAWFPWGRAIQSL
jgi:p-aminobenzoyl-glutamate transporter AbgT